MRTFVDTDILVDAVDEADARRRSIARDVLAVGADGGLVVSTQVLLTEDLQAGRRHDGLLVSDPFR